jgi:uncharacterized protein YndB with AHSA1/START domain
MRIFHLALTLIALAATPASAEVKSANETGFELSYEVMVAKSPEQVWAEIRSPARWWSKDHTYSGDAANLWMDAQAGGCFCEKLADKGSVEHARVIFAQPGKTLRLQGAFGPLQAHPVIGIMTFELKPADGGGTAISVSYVLGGRIGMDGGSGAIAPMVDKVLGEQVAGLKALLDAPAE